VFDSGYTRVVASCLSVREFVMASEITDIRTWKLFINCRCVLKMRWLYFGVKRLRSYYL